MESKVDSRDLIQGGMNGGVHLDLQHSSAPVELQRVRSCPVEASVRSRRHVNC